MTQTKINMDLTEPLIIYTDELHWVDSPAVGVKRRPLERELAEAGRTTSIVRYAPGSNYPLHIHTGGEEFLVLEGVFSDEHGDYPAGTYVRNPPMSKHTPFTRNGCMIFVKLCQYQEGDDERVVDNFQTDYWVTDEKTGIAFKQLHRFNDEVVKVERWRSGIKSSSVDNMGGEEVLILDGILKDDNGTYTKGTWIRTPAGNVLNSRWTDTGCLMYVKQGHLKRDNLVSYV